MFGKLLVAGLVASASAHVHGVRQEGESKFSPRALVDTSRIPRPHIERGNSKRDTSTIPRPTFGSVPYGVDITKCVEANKWALSFDDGPSEYTHTLLDVLKSNGVKATFFVVGTMMQIWPDIVQREYAEGHQVCSHSWSHEDLEASTEDVRQSEVLLNEAEFISVLGFFPTYFRPPYTSCGPNCLRVLNQWGYHVTDYDTDTKDYEGDYTFAQNVITAAVAAGGSHISLTHDIMEITAETFAQFIIDQAKAAGYEFVTIGECLGDSPSNYYRKPTDGTGTDGSGLTGSGATVISGAVDTATPTPSSSSTSSIVSTSSTPTPTPSTSSTPTPTPTPSPSTSAAGSGSGSNLTISSKTAGTSTTAVAPPIATASTGAGSRAVAALSAVAFGMLAALALL